MIVGKLPSLLTLTQFGAVTAAVTVGWICSTMNKAYLFRFYGAGTILCSFVPVVKVAKAYNNDFDMGSYFFVAKLVVCSNMSYKAQHLMFD